MTAWVLAALLRVAPFLAADEAHLAELAGAIVQVAATREDAALLVAVGYWETGRSWDCTRVGDHGLAWGCWQGHLPVWARKRAANDHAFAASWALPAIRGSLRRCGDLSEYTTGRCIPTNREARVRWQTAQWLLRNVPEAA